MTLTELQSRNNKGRRLKNPLMEQPGPKMLVATMRQALKEFGGESPAIIADWIASVIDPQRPSATHLLTDPEVPLHRLEQAKDLYKLMRVYGESATLRRVGLRLYAASIAAALVHHGQRISEQSDAALSRGLHFLLEDNEMPASLRVLVVEALEKLPKVEKIRIKVDQFGPIDQLEKQFGTLDYVADQLVKIPSLSMSVSESGVVSVSSPPDTPWLASVKPKKKRKKSTIDKDPELGNYYQVRRSYCKACREVKEIRRRLPNRRVHGWVTLLTLGVWLIPWGLFELGARLHYWRCINCHRRIYQSIFS
ncbi:MAG: hypothetical protein IIB54_10860 [Planctomycetes bacterium]|nr:hypothetical protein [Planctomycetota bacterium]